MEQALIGLVGLLIGILLNEYFRHRNRVETYSSKVFERRLEVYEGLMKVIGEAESKVSDALENESVPLAERHQRAFEAGIGVMEYMDKHSLYLNDEITVHCGAAFVGVGDILEMPKGKKREGQIAQYRAMIGDVKRMIRAESGMSEIDRVFRTVTKAKHSSPVIDYYHKNKNEREHAKKQL